MRLIIQHIAMYENLLDTFKMLSATMNYFYYIKEHSDVEDQIVMQYFLSSIESSSIKCHHFVLSEGKFILVINNNGASGFHLIYCEITLLHRCYLKLCLIDLGHVRNSVNHTLFELIYLKLQDALAHFGVTILSTKNDLSRLCLVDVEFQRRPQSLFSSTHASAYINTTYERLQAVLQDIIRIKEQQLFNFIAYDEDSGGFEQWLLNRVIYCSSKNQYSVINCFIIRHDSDISISIFYEKEFEGTELQQFSCELNRHDERTLQLYASIAPLYSNEYTMTYEFESISQMLTSGIYDEISLPQVTEAALDDTNYHSTLINQLIADMAEKMNFVEFEIVGPNISGHTVGHVLIDDFVVIFDIPLKLPSVPISDTPYPQVSVFQIRLSIQCAPLLKAKCFEFVPIEVFERLQEMKTFVFKTYMSNFSMLIYSSLLRLLAFSSTTLEMALLTYRPYSAEIDISVLRAYPPTQALAQAFEDTLGRYLIDSPAHDYFLLRPESILPELNEYSPVAHGIPVNISTAMYITLEAQMEYSECRKRVVMSSKSNFKADFFSFLQSLHEQSSDRTGAAQLRITCLHNTTIKDYINDQEKNSRELQRSQRLKCLETLQRHLHQFVALLTLLTLSSIPGDVEVSIVARAHESFHHFYNLTTEMKMLDVVGPTLSTRRSDAFEEGWARGLIDEAKERIGLTPSSGKWYSSFLRDFNGFS